MTIEETIQKAIEGGYEKYNPGRANMPIEKFFQIYGFGKLLGKRWDGKTVLLKDAEDVKKNLP